MPFSTLSEDLVLGLGNSKTRRFRGIQFQAFHFHHVRFRSDFLHSLLAVLLQEYHGAIAEFTGAESPLSRHLLASYELLDE